MPTGARPQFPTGLARVAISGTIFTHRWVNVFYVRVNDAAGTALTVADLTSIADTFSAQYPHGALGTDWHLTQVQVVYRKADGSELAYTGSYSIAGTGGEGCIHDAAACIQVKWTISDYYRGGHPRTYFAGVTEGTVTNGSDLSPTIAANWSGYANSIKTAIDALTTTNITTLELGTVRYQSADTWLTPPHFRPYTSAVCNTKLGSQRRRIRS